VLVEITFFEFLETLGKPESDQQFLISLLPPHTLDAMVTPQV